MSTWIILNNVIAVWNFSYILGKSKRKEFGKEEFDQIIQNVNHSISMDFVETISEMGFSESSLMELNRLFLQEQAIEKATIFDVGKFFCFL